MKHIPGAGKVMRGAGNCAYRKPRIVVPCGLDYHSLMAVGRQYSRHALSLLLTAQIAAAAGLSLQPSTPSPWQVGGIVNWTATQSGGSIDSFLYRFRARRIGSPYRVWKDF